MKKEMAVILALSLLAALPTRAIETAGLGGGVACFAPAGTGDDALALAAQARWLVVAVEPDAAKAQALREKAAAAGLYGRSLYVHEGPAGRLPFADHYVDLLVAEKESPEIPRVLAPVNGRALVGGKTIVQPELPGSDWWTHKRHGPNNNPVSKDTIFSFPPILQYRAMPMYTSAQGAGLAARGIVYEINDWTFVKPARVNLSGRIFARNAYNGRILWQAEAPADMIAATPTSALIDGALCIADGAGGHIVRYDGLTGKKLPPLEIAPADRRVRWFAHQDGVLYALIGGIAEIKKPFSFFVPPVASQWENHTLHGTELVAWDLAAGKIKWKHTEPGLIDYSNVAVHGKHLYFYAEKTRLAALDPATGKLVWENKSPDWIAKLNRPAKPHTVYVSNVPSMMAADGVLSVTVAECRERFFFDGATGKLLSAIPVSHVKSVMLDGKIQSGNSTHDPQTGEKCGEGLPSPGGSAWCGVVTYSPGAGIIGHSTLGYKSACAAGAWVAGGILTYSPTLCDCGATPGAAGFASGGDLLRRAKESPEHPLVKGPAFGTVENRKSKIEHTQDWPAYRGGPAHRGSSGANVGAAGQIRWQSVPAHPFACTVLYNQSADTFDERPVPPILAEGKVFTAGSDGIVRALALDTGKELWAFYADGPALTPPAWADGALFVPCGDGWLYALEASSGRLAWRRRLAPIERRILVFDQLVSNWPVLSAVVDEGVVYAAAGCHNTDGVKSFALDARTGDIRWSRWSEPAGKTLAGSHQEPDRPVQGLGGHLTLLENRLWGAGFYSTPLSLDRRTGEEPVRPLREKMINRVNYYTFQNLMDMRGQDVLRLAGRAVLAGGGDLLEEHQLREGKNGRTVYRLYYTDEQGDFTYDPAPVPVFYGRIAPAFDDRLIVYAAPPPYTVKKDKPAAFRYGDTVTAGLNAWPLDRFLDTAKSLQLRTPLDKAKTEKDPLGRLFVISHHNSPIFDDLNPRRVQGAQWTRPEIDVNAVALAGNAVILAQAIGWKSLYGWQFDAQTARAPMMEYEGWKLSVLDRDSGKELWSVPLPSEPLFNGLAIAGDGTVVVTLRDGSVMGVQSNAGGRSNQ